MNEAVDPIPAPAATSARWSLRGRLLLIVSAMLLVAWLSGGAALYLALRHASDELFDERLRELTQTVLAFADHELAETAALDRRNPEHEEVALTMESRYRFQIWANDGRLLLRSSRASVATPLAPLSHSGFIDVDVDGELLRVHSARGNSGLTVIQVAENRSRRAAIVPTWGVPLIGLFALTALGVGIVSSALVRRARSVFDESARQLLVRSPTQLAPLDDSDAPREMVPLLDSINTLFTRLESALSAERGFAETAAHELRTPLAALRMQAQVARRALEVRQRERALLALEGSVDRLAHLVDQLLALARVDGLHSEPARQTIDLCALVDEIVADFQPLAAAKHVALEVHLDTPRMQGSPVAIVLLLRNLLGNALRHAPSNGKVRLQSTTDSECTLLSVDDSGPGIAPQERAHVLERLGSAGRRTEENMAGLGLSIVQSVARLHGAVLTLWDSPLGGLRVEVRFPPAAEAAADAHVSTP